MVVRPDARCPSCGELPRLGVRLELLEAVRSWPADRMVMTYQCHRDRNSGRCNAIYPITVRALQEGRTFGA